ncbi:FecCD family ABC transporter permease [Desulfogranum japonicum]|uniref:FecCD family ABC transporter permease n=1 Tax=Desulfogranum japonicum TaxID=231447 RepID=UPI0004906609|nr:iron ABC transporter permease [Desulfogranum japonicum]
MRLTFLFLLLCIIACFSMLLGKYPLAFSDFWSFWSWKFFGTEPLHPQKQALLANIFFEIRLPRILAAMLIGAALSVSGTSYQALFINPLVSPGVLGVLAGASFGAAFGMVFSPHWLAVQCSTLVFAFIAVGIAVCIGRIYRGSSIVLLVLGGIISGAFFTAMLSVIKYTADPYDQLPAIVYWLMGSLSAVDRFTILVVAIPSLVAIVAISCMGRQLNILSMGDEEAQTMGVQAHVIRRIVIFCATLLSALTVMIGGMIGWVGLIIPHISRMIVGPNNQVLLPASALIGAIYLLVVDDVARLLFSYEIPVGIATSLIGIPFFVLVLKNAHRGWQ